MKLIRLLLPVSLIFVSLTPAWAQSQLKPILKEAREKHELTALGAVTIIDGQIGEPVTVGVTGRGMTKIVPSDARWHLGSCGKSMTAMLAAVMVERGELRWEQTLGESFTNTDIEVHPGYRDVTIDQLLRHRGGLPGDLIKRPIWGGLRMQGGPAADQRRLITKTCLSEAPNNPPGEEFKYANEGYVIVGHILESIAGKPYEELMAELVFEPMGLTSAGFGPPPGETDPRGHKWNTPLPPHRLADNPEGLSPAGRIHMSLGDWAVYVQAHLRAARGESYELVSQASYERMQTTLDGQHYALGWGRPSPDWAAGPALAHAGSNTMWWAEVWIAPARNAAFLVATNHGTEQANNACRELIETLTTQCLPTPKQAPAVPLP